MLKSGIYKILSWVDGKIYIGCSININKRWQDHKYLLKTNQHRNVHLQAAWNKYKENNFQFIILEYCEKEKLVEIEQFWIDITNCTNDNIGYNFSKCASATQLGLKRSNETKLKLSISHKGKKPSHEAMAKTIAANTNAKRSPQAIINLKIAQQKIANDKRKFDKWPHEKGYRCECYECKEKKSEYKRNWWRENMMVAS